jgi:hypothetical protein
MTIYFADWPTQNIFLATSQKMTANKSNEGIIYSPAPDLTAILALPSSL